MNGRTAAVRTVLEPPGNPREVLAESASGAPVRISSAWWSVNGGRMHVRTTAGRRGGASAVLVHGLGVSSRYMVPLLAELGARFDVYAPDLPGFGLSDHPPGALALADLTEALLTWLDSAGLDDVALIGNSLGCQIAVEAAARQPKRVRRLVLQGPTFDMTASSVLEHGLRLLRTGVHEPPDLNLVLARDYVDCGLRRPARVLADGLRHPLLERLGEVRAPTLVIRGELDRLVSTVWAEAVTAALPRGELAVIPGAAHTLNYSAARPFALLCTSFIDARKQPRFSSTRGARPAEDSVADFDSASAMLRAAASSCRGESLEAVGVVPRPLVRAAARLAPALRLLPDRARELVYSRASGREAVPPAQAHTVSAEAIAEWTVAQYPRRRYPAVVLGSSSGALVHLCAAVGMPFLPQTLLVPIAQPDAGPDEPRNGLTAGAPAGRLLLEANPELQLHHMHDPNQDRRSLQRMTYFRVKRRRLGPAFERYLERTLAPGATIFVTDCRLRWPVTTVRERYVFQFGALGGLPAEEFHTGSPRVAEYLAREGSGQTRWDPPPPDTEAPEAEWGFEPALLDDIHRLAKQHGWRVRPIVFEDPEDLSSLVADLYRWWYERRGLPTDRLLVESFILLDGQAPLRTGTVPLWLKFPVDPSAERAERYLDDRAPFDDIRLTLFSHGTEGVGVAGIDRWRAITDRARRTGGFLAVDEDAYPRDLATFARFSQALRRLEMCPPPTPLSLAELDEFTTNAGRYPGVQWPDPPAG